MTPGMHVSVVNSSAAEAGYRRGSGEVSAVSRAAVACSCGCVQLACFGDGRVKSHSQYTGAAFVSRVAAAHTRLLGVRASQLREQRRLANRWKANKRCAESSSGAGTRQLVRHDSCSHTRSTHQLLRGHTWSPARRQPAQRASAQRAVRRQENMHGARGRASKPSPVLEPVPAPGAGSSSCVRSFASCAFRRPK
jgi:hypothetical protein